MVGRLGKALALALRTSGIGGYCIGERDSTTGFDFGDSPAELGGAVVAGKT